MMLVLLDRDGVMNVDLPSPGVLSVETLRVYPYAGSAIRLLKESGFQVAVVTNQSAIGKGLLSEEGLVNIHAAIQQTLQRQAGVQIDAFYHCPDHPDRAGPRRKPADGMLREACADFNADPAVTPMVGDALSDLQAAFSAGCTPYLVLTGKGEQTHARLQELTAPVTVCADLLDAAMRIILQYSHA